LETQILKPGSIQIWLSICCNLMEQVKIVDS